MIRFAETFRDRQKVYTLCRQLSWSHFRNLIYIGDPLAREFFIEKCRLERLSVRALQKKNSMRFFLFPRPGWTRRPSGGSGRFTTTAWLDEITRWILGIYLVAARIFSRSCYQNEDHTCPNPCPIRNECIRNLCRRSQPAGWIAGR